MSPGIMIDATACLNVLAWWCAHVIAARRISVYYTCSFLGMKTKKRSQRVLKVTWFLYKLPWASFMRGEGDMWSEHYGSLNRQVLCIKPWFILSLLVFESFARTAMSWLVFYCGCWHSIERSRGMIPRKSGSVRLHQVTLLKVLRDTYTLSLDSDSLLGSMVNSSYLTLS